MLFCEYNRDEHAADVKMMGPFVDLCIELASLVEVLAKGGDEKAHKFLVKSIAKGLSRAGVKSETLED